MLIILWLTLFYFIGAQTLFVEGEYKNYPPPISKVKLAMNGNLKQSFKTAD